MKKEVYLNLQDLENIRKSTEMDLEIEKRLQIRYIKLHFYLCIDEDTVLPRHKSSALRGGMGEMLLRSNCIQNRLCENCSFNDECIVQRIMYSKMRIKPAFMSSGDSVGYILNCENEQEEFHNGDEFTFDLTLFGNTIVYFNQILQAFYMLGQEGIGKNKSHFHISKVTNSKRNLLVDGQNVYMSEYKVMTVNDYVNYRAKNKEIESRMIFHTPVSLKFQGNMEREFSLDAILSALCRRIYILDCYEGIDLEMIDYKKFDVKMTEQKSFRKSERRYSERHNSAMFLNGICGYADLEFKDNVIRNILLAGEILQIGKNTSFGFGLYSMLP